MSSSYIPYIDDKSNDSFCKYLQQIEYVDDIKSSISNSLNNVYDRSIDHSIEQTFSIIEKLGEMSDSIIDLGLALDDRLKLILEQQRFSNKLNYNICKLLEVPDTQKERKYNIEQGFKHYSNSMMNPKLIKDALKKFLRALEIEETDYFILYQVGIIYLYTDILDPKKAEDYLLKSANYAVVELNPKVSLDDIYEQAAIAAFLQQKYKKSIKHIQKSLSLVPGKKITRFNYARFLAADLQGNEAVKVLKPLIIEDRTFAAAADLDGKLSTSSEVQILLVELRDKANNELKEEIDLIKNKYRVLLNREGELNNDLDSILLRYKKELSTVESLLSAMESLDSIPGLLKKADIWLKDYNYTKKVLLEIKKKYKELLIPNSVFVSDLIKVKNEFINSKKYNSLRDVAKQSKKIKENAEILFKAKKNIEDYLLTFKNYIELLEKNEFKDLVQDLEKSLLILNIDDVVSKNDGLQNLKNKFEDWVFTLKLIKKNLDNERKHPFLDENNLKKIKHGLDAHNYKDCLQSLKLFDTLQKKYEEDLKNKVRYQKARNISLVIISSLLLFNIITLLYIFNYYTPYDISLEDIIDINIFIKNIYLILFLSILVSCCFAFYISFRAGKYKEAINDLYEYIKYKRLFLFIKIFLLLHIIMFPPAFLLLYSNQNDLVLLIADNIEQALDFVQLDQIEYYEKTFNKEMSISFDSLQKNTAFVDLKKYIVPNSSDLNTALNQLHKMNSLLAKIQQLYEYEKQYKIRKIRSKFNNKINKINDLLKKKKDIYETLEVYNSKQLSHKQKIESIKGDLEKQIQIIQDACYNSLNSYLSNIYEKRQVLTNKIYQIKSNNFSIKKIEYDSENKQFYIDAKILININLQISTTFEIFFPINSAKQYGENPELFDAEIFVKIDTNKNLLPYKISLIDKDKNKYIAKSINFSLKKSYYSNKFMLYTIWSAFIILFVFLVIFENVFLLIFFMILWLWGTAFTLPYALPPYIFNNLIIDKTVEAFFHNDISFKVYDPLSYFFARICQLIIDIPGTVMVVGFICWIVFLYDRK